MLEFHHHIADRMLQRGVTETQVVQVIEAGWFGDDGRPGSQVKVMVFSFGVVWEGRFFGCVSRFCAVPVRAGQEPEAAGANEEVYQ